MSREQATDHQAHQDTAAPEAAGEATHGLPPALHGQVLRLGPGDAQALRDLLTLYPVFSRAILAVAAPHVGNAAVQRALAMVQQNAHGQPTEGAGANQALIKDTLQDDAAKPAHAPTVGKPPPVTGLIQETLADEPTVGKPPPVTGLIKETLADEPTVGKPPPVTGLIRETLADGPAVGKPPPVTGLIQETLADEPAKSAAVPAWVAGARKYNEAHAELVSDFNDATGGSCLDAGGQLDPQAVARWQAKHGLAADGKVGPQTLAAARQASAKAGPAAVAADQRIPV
jgi:Putative peptidoglycan binding domain